MGNDPSELGRQGYKKCFFTLIKPTGLLLLDNQHTQQHTMMNNRNPQKRVERFLPDFLKESITWMILSVFKIDRLGSFTNITHQALV